MTETDLKKLHELELILAKEFARICEKHKIRYFMIAGTLLGAVRHGGFIPWDEDMDFGMLRSDFERFLAVCREELDTDTYFLQTGETDPAYTYAFAKLRLNGTKIVEEIGRDTFANKGIFIDIFPFDNVPDNRVLRRIHEKERYLWKNMLAVRLGYHNGRKRAKILQVMLRLASRLLPVKVIRGLKERAFTRYNKGRSKYVVTAEGSYRYDREIIPRRFTEKLQPLSFEDTEFFTFASYEDYLTNLYGDYRKLPPVEERNKHSVMTVEFGKYGQ